MGAGDHLEPEIFGFFEQGGVDQMPDVNEQPADHGGLEEKDDGRIDVIILKDLRYRRVEDVAPDGQGQADQVQRVAQTARLPQHGHYHPGAGPLKQRCEDADPEHREKPVGRAGMNGLGGDHLGELNDALGSGKTKAGGHTEGQPVDRLGKLALAPQRQHRQRFYYLLDEGQDNARPDDKPGPG